MSMLELRNVWKVYSGGVSAVIDANFSTREGEFVALLGPSGCGKSSTMRMIAGLESITKGEILINGSSVNGLEPRQRNVALAFESYALYSPLTVYENLAFPLRSAGETAKEIDRKVRKVAHALRIDGLLGRLPKALSGGQAQRVSLARALIRRPNVMLLDEPLSHLDYRLRSELRVRIRHIHDQSVMTTVYVTHDQEEAVALADRIIVMNHAKIQQVGDVDTLWNRPVNRFVAGFLGDPAMNFLDVTLNSKGTASCTAGSVAGLGQSGGASGTDCAIGFRPEHAQLCAEPIGASGIGGVVRVNEFHGERCVLTIDTASGRIKTVAAGDCAWEPGNKVFVYPDPDRVHLFNRISGLTLEHAEADAASPEAAEHEAAESGEAERA